jgi:hypothetical protein
MAAARQVARAAKVHHPRVQSAKTGRGRDFQE